MGELEAELHALRGRGGAKGGNAENVSPQQLQTLQMELEDMRVAKERAEAMLAKAVGG